MAVYYQTWSEPWTQDASKMTLANLDPRFEVVYLSFADPRGTYTPGSFAGTGLQFSMDFSVVQGAIKILQSRNVKVMLSVGGATYPFDNRAPCAMVTLAKDLGCDGIDVDCENLPWGPLVELYKKHTSLPISAAVWSTGAFPNTMTQDLTKYIELADWLNIMAYDAGKDFSAVASYQAYRKLYSKKLYLGFCVGDQSWGGHVTTLTEVATARAALQKGDSFFIWSLQKTGSPSVSEILNVFSSTPTPPTTTQKIPCPNCKTLLGLIL